MSIQNKFNTFHDNIKLGRKDLEYTNARLKDDSITNAIKEIFRDNGYPIIEDFIQGSLATHTGIKEKGLDFDIDRAIVIEEVSAPENPITPKLAVLNVLENRGFKNAKIKKPCVTADYKQEYLHIDIPIYRKYENGQYELAVGKKNSDENNREWSPAAPKELINWVNDSSLYSYYSKEKHTQYRRLVRYLKRWRNHVFCDERRKKIFSIGLTVMLKEQFYPSIDSDGFPDDLISLKETLSKILCSTKYFSWVGVDEYKISVLLPVGSRRDIFDGSSIATGTQLKNKLQVLLDTLNLVLNKENEQEQCELLRSVFGEDFPEVSKNTSSSSSQKIALFSESGVVGTSQGA